MKTKANGLIYNGLTIITLIILTTLQPICSQAQNSERESKSERAEKSERESKTIEQVDIIEKVETNQNEHSDDESLKQITTSVNIDFRPKVNFTIYDAETEILPARNSAIEVQILYHAEGNEKDLEKLEAAMRKHLLIKSGNNIKVSTQFYDSYISNIITPIMSKITIYLKDGSKIHLSKFKISKVKLFVPSDLDLELDAKYCKIDIDFSIHGDLNVKAYDVELKANNVSGNTTINGKYSKLKFDALSTTRIEGYETKLRADNISSLKLESKYSQIKIEHLENINYSGYEDEIELNQVDTYNGNTKYTNIEIEECKTVTSTMYEGKLEIQTAGTVQLQSKYGEYEFGTLTSIKIKDGYENDLYVENLKTFSSTNSKYSKYEFSNITESFIDTLGYENKASIAQLDKEFKFVALNGKYAKLEVSIPTGISYVFQGDIQYPDINFDESKLKKDYSDKDGSRLKFLYYKGKKDLSHQIRASGYEVDVTLDNF